MQLIKYLIVVFVTFTALFARSESTDLILDRQYNEFSKSLPQRLDSITSLDAVMRVGSKINLTYTIDGKYEGIDVYELFESKSFIREYKGIIKENILNGLCTTPQTKILLEFGYKTAYLYYDRTGKYLFDIELEESDCKNIK